MANKLKEVPLKISNRQLAHIVRSTLRNLIDLKVHESGDSVRFFMVLGCVDPEICLPATEAPETDEDVTNIMAAHWVLELKDFFEDMISVHEEDNNHYRALTTVEITKENMARFLYCLDDLDLEWEEMEQAIADEENFKREIQGKNFVEGNNTVQ